MRHQLELTQRGQLGNLQGGSMQSSGIDDVDYKVMKFEDWRQKIICSTCQKEENDIILSCGHMSCSRCIEE